MSRSALADVLTPVVVAPMGGGPSTPGLVIAAAGAGALGFLAAGYKSAAAMGEEMAAVRSATDRPFGVNVFVPQPPADDPRRAEAVAAYLASLQPDGSALGADVGAPAWDDDDWEAKLAVLLEHPPAVVSFTFGCPDPGVIGALGAAGAAVVVTVTTPEEAGAAAAAGAHGLCVQGFEAGAHRGTWVNDDRPGQDWGLLALVQAVAMVTDLPQIATGGIVGPAGVRAALAAGAVAAQCGTAFLRCPESGTNPVHRAALADPRFTTTAVTRAFSGRRARGLLNRFMLEHRDAPAAYPQINNATRSLRAAAVAAGDADRLHLWAGQGWRSAVERPAAEVVEMLVAGTGS